MAQAVEGHTQANHWYAVPWKSLLPLYLLSLPACHATIAAQLGYGSVALAALLSASASPPLCIIELNSADAAIYSLFGTAASAQQHHFRKLRYCRRVSQ
jgi:hypothetical protein